MLGLNWKQEFPACKIRYNLSLEINLKPTNTSAKIDLRKLVPGLILGFVIILILLFIGDIKSVTEVVFQFDWRLFPVILLLTLTTSSKQLGSPNEYSSITHV